MKISPLLKDDVYVLRSDGMLYRIVTDSATGGQKSFDLGKIELPEQVDFETLYYDQTEKH